MKTNNINSSKFLSTDNYIPYSNNPNGIILNDNKFNNNTDYYNKIFKNRKNIRSKYKQIKALSKNKNDKEIIKVNTINFMENKSNKPKKSDSLLNEVEYNNNYKPKYFSNINIENNIDQKYLEYRERKNKQKKIIQ